MSFKIPWWVKFSVWVLDVVPLPFKVPMVLKFLVPALEKLIELLPDHKQVAARNELPTAHTDALTQKSAEPVKAWLSTHCEGGTCPPSPVAS